MGTTALFSFSGVSIVGEQRARLRDVDLDICDDTLTVIVGPSGSGKSTLLRMCNRLEAADAGTVRFRGTDIATVDALALRRQVGMLFQRPVLFEGTVRDNLLVAQPEGDDASFAELLDTAELSAAFLDRTGDLLSGGEAQRVCLARALAAEPKAMLMDEPTSALDPTATAAIERLARRLVHQHMPVIWVTHDTEQLQRLAQDLVVLMEGQVVQQGPAVEVLAHPEPAVATFLYGADGEAS